MSTLTPCMLGSSNTYKPNGLIFQKVYYKKNNPKCLYFICLTIIILYTISRIFFNFTSEIKIPYVYYYLKGVQKAGGSDQYWLIFEMLKLKIN